MPNQRSSRYTPEVESDLHRYIAWQHLDSRQARRKRFVSQVFKFLFWFIFWVLLFLAIYFMTGGTI